MYRADLIFLPPVPGCKKIDRVGGINKNTARGFKCARKLAQAQGAQTEVSKIFGDYGATEKSAEEKKRDFPRSYSQVIDIWFLRVVKRFGRLREVVAVRECE